MSSKKFWNIFVVATLVIALAGAGIGVYNYSQIQNAKARVPGVMAQFLSRLTKAVVQAPEGADAELILDADDGDDNEDTWTFRSTADDNYLRILNHISELVTVQSTGRTAFTTTVDSTMAYQWHDADGGAFVNFDSDNERVGIGTDVAVVALHVALDSGGLPAISGATGVVYSNSSTGSDGVTVSMISGSSGGVQYNFGDTDDENAGNFKYDNNGDFFTWRTNGAGEDIRLTSAGNLGIGTTSPNVTLDVTPTIGIGNPTAPGGAGHALVIQTSVTTPTVGATDTALIYASADPAEMHVIDGAGNDRIFSPHAFKDYTPGPGDPYPWSYYACNSFIGICVNVDMSGAIRELERLSGKTFIYTRTIATVDWDDTQAASAASINASRLAAAAAVEVEVTLADALEVYTPTVTVAVTPTQWVTTTTTIYEVDTAAGELITVTAVVSDVLTTEVAGEPLYRVRADCRVDSGTGVAYCPTGENDAIFAPYEPAIMPDWMQLRISE